MFYDRKASFSHGFPVEDLGTFLENTLDCIFVLDADWHLIFVNKRAQAEIAPGREIVGRTLWEAFPDAQNDKFGATYRSVMQSRCPTSFEAFFKPLDAWYEVQAIPLTSGIAVSFRNINVRRRAEECSHATTQRYQLAARATNDLIWDWDLGSDHRQRNHAGSGMFGYSETELGNNAEWWEERIHPDDRDTVMREAERVIACGDERFEADYRFLQADGTYAIVHDRGFVSRDEHGRSVRMVGAMQDQSALHQLAKRLAERERRLETVFSQAMVAIMQFDLSGRLLLCNEKFCSILGRSFEELQNLSFRDYTHPDDLDCNQVIFEEHLTSGKPFQIEKRYLRSDGTSVWCNAHVSFVLNSSGAPESCIVVAEDITARKIAEDAMQESKNLLQA